MKWWKNRKEITAYRLQLSATILKIMKSQIKPSSKECVMKLNFFKHRTLLRVVKQTGVDNRSI